MHPSDLPKVCVGAMDEQVFGKAQMSEINEILTGADRCSASIL